MANHQLNHANDMNDGTFIEERNLGRTVRRRARQLLAVRREAREVICNRPIMMHNFIDRTK